MRTVIVRFADAGHADGGVRGLFEEVGRPPVMFRSTADLLELLLQRRMPEPALNRDRQGADTSTTDEEL